MRKILFFIPLFLWTCGGGGSSPTEPIIEPPVVQNFTLSTFVNTPIEFSLSGVESENLPLSFGITTQPINGIIELDGVNGTYTPNLNFIGADSFTYIATSTNGQSNIGLVQITVSRDENNFELIFSIEGRRFDARDFTELSGGSFVIGGIAQNSGGFINQQTYLIGLNNDFEEIWRKYTGPIGNTTYMKKIKSTGDGGFIVFGLHESSFYLEKFTSLGNLEWSQSYSSVGSADDVDILDDSTIVMVGGTTVNGYGQTMITIVDSNGNLQSENTYGEDGYGSRARAITKSNDGGFLVAGQKKRQNSSGWYGKPEIMKFSSTGEVEWSNNFYFGPREDRFGETPFAVTQDQDGNYYITVIYPLDSNSDKTLIFKVGPQGGDPLWNVEFNNLLYQDIEYSSDNSIILTGRSESFFDLLVYKFDLQGNLIVDKNFGDSTNYNSGESIKELSSGNYAILGGRNYSVGSNVDARFIIINNNLD
ncbi:Ig-like domain-containing protein [Candidatus Marinimicrobia bacterium]|nr:Ig-like domain-containing protein [Candidatus Neomarinimicrobiota bacterium]